MIVTLMNIQHLLRGSWWASSTIGIQYRPLLWHFHLLASWCSYRKERRCVTSAVCTVHLGFPSQKGPLRTRSASYAHPEVTLAGKITEVSPMSMWDGIILTACRSLDTNDRQWRTDVLSEYVPGSFPPYRVRYVIGLYLNWLRAHQKYGDYSLQASSRCRTSYSDTKRCFNDVNKKRVVKPRERVG